MPTREPASTLKSPKALKSYLARIKDATGSRYLSAFSAFPPKTEFTGQDRGENIVLLLRQHPAVLIPQAITVLLMLLAPLLIPPLLGLMDYKPTAGDYLFGLGLVLLWSILALSVAGVSFFKWFFNVNIVTNERIVDIDFDQLFNHRVSEAQLEKIEDVSHSAVGMWSVVFDFGSVYIQTAAEQREFEFLRIPRPRDVQDTINDLLELKQSRHG